MNGDTARQTVDGLIEQYMGPKLSCMLESPALKSISGQVCVSDRQVAEEGARVFGHSVGAPY